MFFKLCPALFRRRERRKVEFSVRRGRGYFSFFFFRFCPVFGAGSGVRTRANRRRRPRIKTRPFLNEYRLENFVLPVTRASPLAMRGPVIMPNVILLDFQTSYYNIWLAYERHEWDIGTSYLAVGIYIYIYNVPVRAGSKTPARDTVRYKLNFRI